MILVKSANFPPFAVYTLYKIAWLKKEKVRKEGKKVHKQKQSTARCQYLLLTLQLYKL